MMPMSRHEGLRHFLWLLLCLPLGLAQAEDLITPTVTTDIMTQRPMNKPESAPDEEDAEDLLEDEEAETSDPLEPVNRVVYKFNDGFDRFILRPITQAYVVVTPSFAREGVRNFLDNLFYPKTAINGMLQGKMQQGVTDVGRFLVNLTLGFGGVIDPATDLGFRKNNEDFGQTLGHYGVGAGPYLVLPLVGPASVRDTVGRVADYPFSPLTYIDERGVELVIGGLSAVSFRAQLLQFDRTLEDSFDPYAFQREAYTAIRQSAIQR